MVDLAVPIITIGLGVGAAVMIHLGDEQDNKILMQKPEIEKIKRNPSVGFSIIIG